MKMDEVRSIPRSHSIKPDRLSKAELTRTIQSAEGDFDCFATPPAGNAISWLFVA